MQGAITASKFNFSAAAGCRAVGANLPATIEACSLGMSEVPSNITLSDATEGALQESIEAVLRLESGNVMSSNRCRVTRPAAASVFCVCDTTIHNLVLKASEA